MKQPLNLAYSWLLVLVFLACRKSHDVQAFNYNNAVGIWVPYQVVFDDGTVVTDPFLASNWFDVYAESVKLNADRTYVGVTWLSDSTFRIFPTSGRYEFKPFSNQLVFTGTWPTPMVTKQVQMKNNELRMKWNGQLVKFRKRHAGY